MVNEIILLVLIAIYPCLLLLIVPKMSQKCPKTVLMIIGLIKLIVTIFHNEFSLISK
jgi:hypothetical protein